MKLNHDQFYTLSNGIADIADNQGKIWTVLYWKEPQIGKENKDINHYIGIFTTHNLDFLSPKMFNEKYPDKDIYMSINGVEFMYSSSEDREIENKQTDSTRRAYNQGFEDGMNNCRAGGRYI